MAETSPLRAELGPAPAQAAAELCGWLEAGARAAALLAPAGLPRTRAFDAVAEGLARRFAVTRLAGKEGESAESFVVRADAAARRAVGRAALVLVEDGELLSPAEARSLRALADHAPGDLRLVVGLAPSARAAEVLRALGPGLERVTLGAAPPPRVPAPAPLPRRVHAGALALAAGSIAAALALVVPRFGVTRSAPVAAPPAAVSAPPPLPAAGAGPPVVAPAAPPSGAARPVPGVAPGARPEPAAASAAARAPLERAQPQRTVEEREAAPAPRTPATPSRPAAPRTAAPAAASPAAPVAAARPETRAAGPARPAGGYLFVNAIPRADITVNGAPAGATPVVRFPLARGPHRVVALFADGRSEERRIDAVGAETYVVFGGTPR